VINFYTLDADSWRRFVRNGGAAEIVDWWRSSGTARADAQQALGVAGIVGT
jgi:hypothetical protein